MHTHKTNTYTGRSKSLGAPDEYSTETRKNIWNSFYTHTTDDLKLAIAEHIRNADRAILNTVFENTVRRVNKCL
jgi:hypothetical protein